KFYGWSKGFDARKGWEAYNDSTHFQVIKNWSGFVHGSCAARTGKAFRMNQLATVNILNRDLWQSLKGLRQALSHVASTQNGKLQRQVWLVIFARSLHFSEVQSQFGIHESDPREGSISAHITNSNQAADLGPRMTPWSNRGPRAT